MEHHKISKLLNDSSVSKFVTRKWIEENDLPGNQYTVRKNIRFKTPMLRSDLCDYSDAYIVVKEEVSVKDNTNNNKIETRNKKLVFKNNALFRSSISKINNSFIGNAEDLEIVMSMYNLLEYSDNYSMTFWKFVNYCRDKAIDDANGNKDAGKYRINNKKTTTSTFFE